jgi:hypothetical protein
MGSGINRVQVYIGADRDNNGIFLGEAELGFEDSTPVAQYGPQFATSGWRLTFKPTQFHANTYLLFAYARSAVSGKEDVAQRFLRDPRISLTQAEHRLQIPLGRLIR